MVTDADDERAVKPIVDLLMERGRYRSMPLPVSIEGVEFEVDAVLEGPGKRAHTVLVASSTHDPGDALRRVRALLLMLERTRSTRPVSLVWVGPLDRLMRRRFESLCRTLVVEQSARAAEILAPLLPLVLPEPVGSVGSGSEHLERELASLTTDPLVKALGAAAEDGEDAVQATLLEHLERAFSATKRSGREVEDAS